MSKAFDYFGQPAAGADEFRRQTNGIQGSRKTDGPGQVGRAGGLDGGDNGRYFRIGDLFGKFFRLGGRPRITNRTFSCQTVALPGNHLGPADFVAVEHLCGFAGTDLNDLRSV